MYNVLIVDDDFRDRNGICNTIKKFDLPLSTYTADCANEALSILKEEEIDILITDIKMPDILGIDLAKIAKKENPQLTIILVSAHKDFHYAQAAIDFGAIKYLLKPYFIDDLVSALNDAIEICNLKNKEKNDTSLPVNANEQNDYVLNYITGENSVDYNKVSNLFDDQELQPILIKFLKETGDSNKLYLKLKNLFSHAPFVFALPNSKCLILNNNQNKATQEYFESIIEIFRNDFETEICIAYSQFTQVSQLAEEYKRLNQTGEYFFFTTYGLVVPTQSIMSSSTETELSIDAIMDKIQLLIEIENYSDFIPMVALLFNTLKHTSHFSALYAKCISSNIVNLLYKKHKSNITEQEILVKIFSSDSADEIVMLFQEIVEKISVKNSDDNIKRLISKALNIIENEYNNDISLENISEKLYISPAHLSRLFKKEIGKNFVDFLREYRLKKASELLKNTNLKINEIAKMVGYDSTSYFTTIFHKFYHTTPAQFREKGDN